MNPSVHEVCCPQESLPARTDELRCHKCHWKAPLAKHEEGRFPGLQIQKLQKTSETKKGADHSECPQKRSGVIARVFLLSYGTLTQVLVSLRICMHDAWLPQRTTPSSTDQHPLCWRCFPHSFQSQQVISDSR